MGPCAQRPCGAGARHLRLWMWSRPCTGTEGSGCGPRDLRQPKRRQEPTGPGEGCTQPRAGGSAWHGS
eukprot:11157652-Lingulodinium_polyedra.AAC.1